MEIKNATIVETMLGFEDHGIFTFMIRVKASGFGIGYGGWTGDAVTVRLPLILKALGVDRWEQLKGLYCRMKLDGNRCVDIGNILDERWVEEMVEMTPGPQTKRQRYLVELRLGEERGT